MRRLKRSLVFLTVTVMLCGSLLSFGTAYANEAVNETEQLISEPITNVPAVASVGANEIVSGKIYRIKDANSGLYLTLPGNDANLSNVNVTTKDNAALNQQFKIVYDETYGFYRIHTMMSSFGTNRVLDINSTVSSPPANGSNVHIYVIEIVENFNSYGWQISDVGNDKVKIVSDYNNSLALTVANGGTASGTNVRVNSYSGAEYQKWILEEVESNAGTNANVSSLVDGGIYRIKDFNGNYLTIAPNAAGNFDANMNNVEVRPAVAHICQEFKVERNSDGSYYIRAMVSSNGTNRLLDVNSTNINEITNGANVHLYAPGDENSSRWKIEYLSVARAFTIKINAKLTLGMAGSGTNVQMASFHGGLNQQWFFEPVPSVVLIEDAPTSPLIVGESYQLTEYVYPPQSVTWSSSNSATVTVDSNGTIFAAGMGVAIITATTASGDYDQVTITVNQPEIVGYEGIYKFKYDDKYLYSYMDSSGNPVIGLKEPLVDDYGNLIEDSSVLWAIVELNNGYHSVISMNTRAFGSPTYGYSDYVLQYSDNGTVFVGPLYYYASQQWNLNIDLEDQKIWFECINSLNGICVNTDDSISVDSSECFALEEYIPAEYLDGTFTRGLTQINGNSALDVVIFIDDRVLNLLNISYTATTYNSITGTATFTEIPYYSFLKEWAKYLENLNIRIYPIKEEDIRIESLIHPFEKFPNSYIIFVKPGTTRDAYASTVFGQIAPNYIYDFTSVKINDDADGATITLCNNSIDDDYIFFELPTILQKATLLHEVGHALKLRHPNIIYNNTSETNNVKSDFLPTSVMISGIESTTCVLTAFDHLTLKQKMEELQ